MHEETILQTKLQKISQSQAPPTDWRLWRDVLIYSVILTIFATIYFFVQSGSLDYRGFNRIIADVGMLLIGLSFALSGLCYFWNFADHFIIYRKHLGLAGFGFALAHGLLSLFFMPQFFPFPTYYLEEKNLFPFISALIALVIYTIMAAISNRYAVHELGGKTWRMLLRVGYIGYVFTLLHFGLKGYPFWIRYFMGEGRSVLPSMSLLVFTSGLAVIILRLTLLVATSRKTPPPANQVTINNPDSNHQQNTSPPQNF